MTTEEKIVNKALEMFNSQGIEYVGVREIAAALNMRVGNITYYFPTKDDLVFRLSSDLKVLNSKIVVDHQNLTMLSFLDMFKFVFYNHLKYRCLMLSFVHLIERNKMIADQYKETQNDRNAALRANIKTLQLSGFLKLNNDQELNFLVSSIALIVRFWISEATVSFRHAEPEEQVKYYIALIAQLLTPYLTAKGKKQLQETSQ